MLFHLQLLSLLMIPTEHMPQVISKQNCMWCFLQEVTCTVLFAVYLSHCFSCFVAYISSPISADFLPYTFWFCTALHEKLHQSAYYCSFDSFFVTFLYIPPANNGINLQTTERKEIAQYIAGKVIPTLKQKTIQIKSKWKWNHQMLIIDQSVNTLVYKKVYTNSEIRMQYEDH